MTTISNHDKLHCAERELKFRFRVYDRLIVRGKMTEAQKAREIELMSAIVEDYRALAADEEPDLWLDIETRRKEQVLQGHQAVATIPYNKSVDVASMPDRIRRLPVSPTGYPVPWFVRMVQGWRALQDRRRRA